jgi:phospho-N-acetylmuramoyl-pentapeptide-transferase
MKQVVRDDGPKTHLLKIGTPTMGGLFMLAFFVISVLLWADLSNFYVWVVLLTAVLFAGIGFLDDYLKVARKNTAGLSARMKILLQSLSSFVILGILYWNLKDSNAEMGFYLPFLKNFAINLGVFYLVVGYFVLVATSNSVNITDGLDGLAIVLVIMVVIVFGIFSYATSNVIVAEYLHLPYLAGTNEITVICGSIIGVGLSFLWFNAHPAQIFMGDVGSLFLGGVLGIIAIIIRQEVLLVIVGGVFVAESLSVILQVSYYKTFGKRLIPMAPLHHSFETKGKVEESKLVIRFWIVGFALALIALMTLKIR